MNEKVLFISESKLKENTSLQDNIDPKLLTNLIWESQQVYIHPILGTPLYMEIVGQITGNTLTGLNQNLLDLYIQPTLQAYVKYDAPLELTYKLTNSSMLTQNPENTVSPALNDMLRIRAIYKDKAEWFATRITRFLFQNRNIYPLFLNSQFAIDNILPERNDYDCGIVLGDKFEFIPITELKARKA